MASFEFVFEIVIAFLEFIFNDCKIIGDVTLGYLILAATIMTLTLKLILDTVRPEE